MSRLTHRVQRTKSKRDLAPARMSTGMVAVCLLAQVSGLSHDLLVEHTRCPEHGEAVHVATGTHASLAHAEADESALAVRAADGASATEEAHEHCLAVSERRSGAIMAEAGAVVPASCIAEIERAPHAMVRVAALPLFLLAPKNSPPA